jgi:predicted nucleotidyltransferase
VATGQTTETQDAVTRVLAAAVSAFDGADIPYVLIGGLASAIHGRPRTSGDIDVLVRQADAKPALEALADAGFETDETNPQWIYKARKDDVQLDLIFWLKGDIYLDDEMLERATEADVDGVRVRVIPPEDLIVVKAVIHDEQTPRHWGDALGVIAEAELDWDYLARRARKGARRVLALLLYAQSNDLIVTDDTVRSLFEGLYGET